MKPAVVTGVLAPATGIAVIPASCPVRARGRNLSATSLSNRSGCAKHVAPQENQFARPSISPIFVR